jgi:hypothetical protein
MPSYILLLKEDPNAFGEASPEQMQAIVERYSQWRQGLEADGRLIDANKLTDEGGLVLSRENGKVRVTDGPFSETKEVIGGYFAYTAESYEEAAEIAQGCPHLDFGTIHIRQIDEVH